MFAADHHQPLHCHKSEFYCTLKWQNRKGARAKRKFEGLFLSALVKRVHLHSIPTSPSPWESLPSSWSWFGEKLCSFFLLCAISSPPPLPFPNHSRLFRLDNINSYFFPLLPLLSIFLIKRHSAYFFLTKCYRPDKFGRRPDQTF